MNKLDLKTLSEAYDRITNRPQLRNLKGTSLGDVFGPQSYEVIINGKGIGYIGWSGDSWGFRPNTTEEWDWDTSLKTKTQAVDRLLSIVTK